MKRVVDGNPHMLFYQQLVLGFVPYEMVPHNTSGDNLASLMRNAVMINVS